jgi:RNA polymerase subunit RPABC4/transcription elongation factor Spt4
MNLKYCARCNNKVMSSIRICPNCGSKVFSDNAISHINQEESQVNPERTENTPLKNKFLIGFSSLGCLAFGLLGVVQIYAGYVGLKFEFGVGWAITAVMLSLLFRFTLPLTVGSFFCALHVWGWSWIMAALFAAPGLIFIIPGMLAILGQSFKR